MHTSSILGRFKALGSGFRVASQVAILLGLPVLSLVAHAEIPEPDTIFYGRIINRTGSAEYLLTQGNLSWVIARPDGKTITLTAALDSLNNGQYSYRLAVPQEALAFGLTVSSNAVPLLVQTASCSHLQISVDGSPASIQAPARSTFNVAQTLRAATYRLDLELFNPLADTGGTGLPDWWKAMYGITDPNADPDHDGWTARQEFLMGSNPTNDNRLPTLVSRELVAYADGTTGVRLQAIDSDSAPTNLTYTLTDLPQTGTLYLRNASASGTNSAVALGSGASFSQDDVNKGRLIFTHVGAPAVAGPDSLGVSLRDENATHPATNGVVTLNVYRPDYPDATLQSASAMAVALAGASPLAGLSSDEQQMLVNYFLSRDHGFVLWDASLAAAAQEISVPSSGLSAAQYAQYVAAYGPDRRYVLVGGAGDDHLVGGMEGDILVSSRGNDRLRGNGGSDLFILSAPGGGNCTIEDFNVAENDVLDISRLLVGSASYVTNYVQLTSSGTNSILGINFRGDGTGFTNLVVTLWGTHFTPADLRGLVDSGNLVTGNKTFPPRITVAATVVAASRNGPVAGVFTLTRTGDTNAQLTVALQITGSAVNGSDYQYITPQATFAPGDRTAVLSVNPYPSSIVTTQIVQVAILAGAGYDIGSAALAQVTIEPLAPQLSIEALEPVASKSDQTPGLFLVTRGGVLDRSVLVRLTIGGTAPASHYAAISPYVNFLPQQTTALISVTPNPSAVISNGVESVLLTLKPDATYRLIGATNARVLIVDRLLTLALWQQRNFPNWTDDLAAFAAADPGQTGIRNLFRYAFGLDALNPKTSKGLPVIQLQNDQLILNFKRPAAISDLDYIVEVSGDLLNWTSDPSDVLQFFPPAGGNDLETVSFRSTHAVSQTPRQFMRVRIVPQ